MAKLLEDMTRLSGEIQALRGSRRAFREELAEGNRNREKDVAEMCADFSGTQARAAERTRARRFAFLKRLKQTVSGQQRAMREDIAAARRAWAGRGA
jgi:ATP-dependent Clp protease ATP-binding subunit ClpA